jgi:hypothetical protein
LEIHQSRPLGPRLWPLGQEKLGEEGARVRAHYLHKLGRGLRR